MKQGPTKFCDFLIISINNKKCIEKGEYRVSTTFNISYLIPFAGEVDNKEEEPTNLRSNPLQGGEDDAILPRKGLVTKAMSKRL